MQFFFDYLNFVTAHCMKCGTDLCLAINNSGWISKIFKKWAINIQHIEKGHEISSFIIMWTNNHSRGRDDLD